jgi:hypothetical protein
MSSVTLQDVQSFSLSYGGTGFQTHDGSIAIWRHAPGLLIVRLDGHADKLLAPPILEAFDQVVASRSPIEMYFDAELLESYHSEVRTRLTSRFVRDRARITSLHVLVRSKIVAMGVSVANIALGGVVTSHGHRQPFARALDGALDAHGVAKFRSGALLASPVARVAGDPR